jgi:hypothetical protein
VLSLGGMMETQARDALKLWKSVMTRGVYSLLVGNLSLGMLRARACCFEPLANGTSRLELHTAVRPEM